MKGNLETDMTLCTICHQPIEPEQRRTGNRHVECRNAQRRVNRPTRARVTVAKPEQTYSEIERIEQELAMACDDFPATMTDDEWDKYVDRTIKRRMGKC